MKPPITLFSIWFLTVCTICSPQKFQVDTIQKTGPLNRRINVVILGDGFTQSELPAFDQEAKKFMNFFLGEVPYKAYKNYFNFFSIRTPSNQSGATNPGTAPDRDPNQPVGTKDTYYGSSFGTANINRLVAITKFQAFNNVMATNFPSYDLAVMIVNSTYYGGSGGNPATFTLHSTASLIATHEIGHLFAALTDEYWAGTVYAREGVNMTRVTNPSLVVWKNWLNQANIGIFQHTGEAEALNWYKPTTHNCLMEQLDKPFCAVCREATANKILKLVNPVETSQPAASTGVTIAAQPVTFQLSLLKPEPNTLKVDWRLNNVPIQQNVDQITITNNQLASPTNTLSVSVLDTTDYIRLESHRQQHVYTYRWTLEKGDVSRTLAVSASKSSLCAGESSVLTATSCAGTITWSTGAVSTSITVSPTQSTTYSAVCSVSGVSSQTASSSLTVFPLPVAEVSNTGPYLENQAIQLTAKGGVSYGWTGPANFTSTEQNPIISFAKVSQSGLYTVVVTSANGCASKAQTNVIISPLLGVNNPPTDVLWLFPNPAKERVQIQTSLAGELTVTLVDGAGHEMMKKSFYHIIELNTETLQKAVYIYHVSNGQQTISGKLLIE